MKTQRDTQFQEKEESPKISKSVRLEPEYIEHIKNRGETDFSAYIRKLIRADMDSPVDFAERDDAKMRYWAEFIISRLVDNVQAQTPTSKPKRGKQTKMNIPDGLRTNIRRLLDDED